MLRCAVYTRKSTEDGLEQEFNSLDAQYEACAAYALSQRHEGWVLSRERYDDGGFSGGNMDRPGLKRLLADIEAGLIDIVLLYKIDRLTRNLSDFARIVDVLDRREASFVSITQAFNTTTSMGRLTLNMLLSFAQFEREVTGERIRDKIAASKRKGMWMGGPVPLGYQVRNRRLVVVEQEAQQVRHIMCRYLALGSVPALVEELDREGYRTKQQRGASGPKRGGCAYRRGTLYHLLSNRIYRGMIVHKGEAFAGEHDAIVDEHLFEQVQTQLVRNAGGSSRRRRAQQASLLIGLVTDSDGRPMTPSHSGKSRKTQRYRYYVTRPDALDGSPAARVSAPDLENAVCSALAEKLMDSGFILDLAGPAANAETLKAALGEADLLAANLRSGSAADRGKHLAQLLRQVRLGGDALSLELDEAGLRSALGLGEAGEEEGDKGAKEASAEEVHMGAGSSPQPFPLEGRAGLTLTVPALKMRKGHRLKLVIPGPDQARAEPPRRDPKLLALLSGALEARDLVLANPELSLSALASREQRCRTRLARLAAFSCLCPKIVTMIVEGRQPTHLTAKRLSTIPLPLCHAAQREVLSYQ